MQTYIRGVTLLMWQMLNIIHWNLLAHVLIHSILFISVAAVQALVCMKVFWCSEMVYNVKKASGWYEFKVESVQASFDW